MFHKWLICFLAVDLMCLHKPKPKHLLSIKQMRKSIITIKKVLQTSQTKKRNSPDKFKIINIFLILKLTISATIFKQDRQTINSKSFLKKILIMKILKVKSFIIKIMISQLSYIFPKKLSKIILCPLLPNQNNIKNSQKKYQFLIQLTIVILAI